MSASVLQGHGSAHDPMCPWSIPMDDCETCDLIARVREDMCEGWYEAQSETWEQGYAAALRDAIAAANEVWLNGKVDSEKGVWYVVQAIEALGGER